MSQTDLTFARVYITIVGAAFAAAVVVVAAALGCVMASGFSLGRALPAVVTGCAVSWISSVLGSIPVTSAIVSKPTQTAQAILLATTIRFVAALVLIAPLALSGWFDRKVLVISLAASYLVLLVVDTIFSVRAMKRRCGGEGL